MATKVTRRGFLRGLAAVAGTGVLAACQPQVVKETVKETVVVPGTPQVVEKPVTVAAPSAPITVTWMKWGGITGDDQYEKIFHQVHPELKDKIKLSIVSPGQGDAETNQALRLAFAAGFGIPDLFQANYASVPEFAQAGKLVDLEEKIKPFLSDLSEGAKSLMQYNGKYVALPHQPKPKVWLYRKDLFEKAGIDPSKVKTFDDFKKAGEQFAAANPGHYFFNLGAQPIHYAYWEWCSAYQDMCWVNTDGTYNITRDEHFAQLLDQFKQIYDSPWNLKVDDYTPDWEPSYKNEKICAWTVGAWGMNSVPNFAPEQSGKWTLTMLPDYQRLGSDGGGGTYFIPKGCKYPEEAWTVAKSWVFETEGALLRWQWKSSMFPVSKTASAKVVDIIKKGERPQGMTDEAYKKYAPVYYGADYADRYFQCLDQLRVGCFNPGSQLQLPIMRNHCERYLAGKENLQDALKNCQKDMETQVGNPYKA